PPTFDKPQALDFAVLKIEESGRRPLPFVLVARADGQVLARGYGPHPPNSQPSGQGTLLGCYYRGNVSKNYLFQYEGPTLAIDGFSGAAIYSERASAVI